MRTFFPLEAHVVGAPSHGEGAQYQVGLGHEMWPDGPAKVLKVQMAYGGQVAGRKAPSFPILEEKRDGTNFKSCPDFDQVVMAVEQMVDPLRRWLITWDRPPGGDDVSALLSDAIKSAFNLPDDDLARPCLQVRTIEIQASGTAAEVVERVLSELRKRNAPSGIRLYAARIADHATASI